MAGTVGVTGFVMGAEQGKVTEGFRGVPERS